VERRSTSGPAWAAIAVLLGGFLLINVAAAGPASPLRPLMPLGVRPPGWARTMAGWLGFDRLGPRAATWLALVLLAAVVAAFVVLVREALEARVAPRVVAVAAAVAIALAVAGPVLLSRDMSSYAVHGRIVALDRDNPYSDTPADHLNDPFTPFVSPEWLRSRSVYGAAFTDLSGLLALAARSPAAAIRWFKVLAGIGIGGAAWAAAALARRRDPSLVALAIAMVGLNPVIVIHTVGGGHNDALIALGLAVAALVAASWRPAIRSAEEGRAKRSILGWRGRAVTAILAVTALVKIVAALPLAMFVLFTLMVREARGARIRTALDNLAVVGVLALVFAGPYAWPGVRAMADLASRRGWASAAHLAERGAAAVGGPAGGLLRVVIAAAFLAALAVILWALVRRPPADPAELGSRWGTGMLGAALAGPYLLPWYAAWFASTVATVGDRAVIWVAVAASCVLGLTGVPAESAPLPDLYRSSLLAVHYVAASAVAILLAVLVLRSLRAIGDRAPAADAGRGPGLAAAPNGSNSTPGVSADTVATP
jgi:alpha-1,6-mannosyltransferase